MTNPVRVQIISADPFIEALKSNAPDTIDLTDHALPDSDQNFGLIEAAAVVAFAMSVVELAELVVKVYNDFHNDELEVTVKTAKGSITVKGRQQARVEALVERLKDEI